MLNLIGSHIGGRVRIIENNKYVIWVVDNRKQIHKIIEIFIKYPPLTSRLRAQLAFILECFEENNIEWYLNARNKKYFNTNVESSTLRVKAITHTPKGVSLAAKKGTAFGCKQARVDRPYGGVSNSTCCAVSLPKAG
jgi:hypothetical protein